MRTKNADARGMKGIAAHLSSETGRLRPHPTQVKAVTGVSGRSDPPATVSWIQLPRGGSDTVSDPPWPPVPTGSVTGAAGHPSSVPENEGVTQTGISARHLRGLARAPVRPRLSHARLARRRRRHRAGGVRPLAPGRRTTTSRIPKRGSSRRRAGWPSTGCGGSRPSARRTSVHGCRSRSSRTRRRIATSISPTISRSPSSRCSNGSRPRSGRRSCCTTCSTSATAKSRR